MLATLRRKAFIACFMICRRLDRVWFLTDSVVFFSNCAQFAFWVAWSTLIFKSSSLYLWCNHILLRLCVKLHILKTWTLLIIHVHLIVIRSLFFTLWQNNFRCTGLTYNSKLFELTILFYSRQWGILDCHLSWFTNFTSYWSFCCECTSLFLFLVIFRSISYWLLYGLWGFLGYFRNRYGFLVFLKGWFIDWWLSRDSLARLSFLNCHFLDLLNLFSLGPHLRFLLYNWSTSRTYFIDLAIIVIFWKRREILVSSRIPHEELVVIRVAAIDGCLLLEYVWNV